METKIEIEDFRGFIGRRRRTFMVIFLLIFFLIGIRALILPPVYRSEATILIKEQEIPQDYVKSTITSYAEERLQLVSRHIMMPSKLMEIINKFDLYREIQDSGSEDKLIERMTGDTSLQTISADVIDKRTGKEREATIAFSLAYEGKDPVIVQKVAKELASLYVKEDLKTRENITSSATSFFQQEATDLGNEILNLENRISKFKKAHIGELPEHNQLNLQAIARLGIAIDQVKQKIRTLQKKIVNLNEQIATVDPISPVVSEVGKMTIDPKVRQKQLRLEYLHIRSRLTEKHPDVKILAKEIGDLEVQIMNSENSGVKVARLNDERHDQSAILEGGSGQTLPDVMRQSNEMGIASNETEVRLAAEKAKAGIENAPDNPVYINLKTQIRIAEVELHDLLPERKKLESMISEYRKKIEKTPFVEKEYNKLKRDYETAKNKHTEIMNKLMAAQVAQKMEKKQHGDRFIIAESPRLPEIPYKPNRFAILLIGFTLAMISASGVSLALEMFNSSIKTPSELNSTSEAPLLAVLPYVENDWEKRCRKIKLAFEVVAIALATILVLIIAYHPIQPLEAVLKGGEQFFAQTKNLLTHFTDLRGDI
jgi:uncharacterized protein involved in exopolysaccharide biosynthesis